jgi:hypothetical protein
MAEEPVVVTTDELRRRAAALSVPIPEDAWEQITPMLNRAFAPLRDVDAEDLKALEPSVVFRAARPS